MKDISPTLKEISRRIQLKRKNAELTQADLAEKLNKSRAYIIALESGTGDVQPSVPLMYDLAELFDCAITDFLPITKLDEVRPEIRGATVSADAEDLITQMLKETRNA